MMHHQRSSWGSGQCVLSLILICSGTLLGQAQAQDTLRVQGSSSSVFSNPEPDTATVDGVDTNSFSWGEPADGEVPSSLSMGDGSFDVEVPVGVVFGPRLRDERPVFSLGTLSYENGTVLEGTEATGVTLDTTISISDPTGIDPVTASYPLELINRPDSNNPVDSADLVLFPDDLSDATFTTPEGDTLILERVGFGDAVGDGFAYYDGFFAFEGGSADTEVLARFAPICEPLLDDDVEPAPTVRFSEAAKSSILKQLDDEDDDDDDDDDDDEDDDDDKVAICHIPPGNPDNAHTITISQSALDAHLDHGDELGACDPADTPEPEDPTIIVILDPDFDFDIGELDDLCGYVGFNWINVVAYTPYVPVGLTLPYIVPHPLLLEVDDYDDGLPFYWDIGGPDPADNIFNVENWIIGGELIFQDTPSEPQLQPGEFMRFITFLVGIRPDNTFDVFFVFTWASAFDGTVDETTVKRTVGTPVGGSGGVFDVAMNLNPEEVPSAVRQLLVDAGARNMPVSGLPDPDLYDRDGDGVNGLVEERAPSFGDGNFDGIDDIDQADVATFETSGGSVTVAAVESGCQLELTESVSEASLGADADFDYPFGLVSFNLTPIDVNANCQSATVTYFFHGLDSAEGFSYRAFDPNAMQWIDFPATLDVVSADGESAVTATVTLVDGGLGDASGADNTINAFASGLARSSVPVAIPTLSWGSMLLLMGLLGILAVLPRQYLQRR